ncbi:MAG: class I SAM-dependent RNA methyltransferase [Thermaceae bacterium]|nr:class I SAM-dependent RNA methyltransferase [Thermaceae bacterium]
MKLRIEKLVGGGLGLARTGEKVALVRGGLPGELVEADLSERKNHLEGTLTKVLEAHPGRYTSYLPPSADLPLEYSQQLPIKQGFVQEALERIAKLEWDVSPIQASPDRLALGPTGQALPVLEYRTAAQYALHPLGGLAYRQPKTNDLVRVEQDPLIAPPLQEAFRLLSSWPLSNVEEVVLRGSLYENRAQVGFIGGLARFFKRTAQALVQEGIAGVVWAEASPKGRFRGQTQHLAGESGLLEDFGGILSTVNVQSFAQVNPKAAGLMFQEAAQIVGNGGKALELYSGSGVLSLHLAHQLEHITTIEISRDAVKRGEADAARLGAGNVEFKREDAKIFAKFLPADLIMVDPPRAGLSEEVMAGLLEHKPERILYISCDPATWARDIGRLVQGGYKLTFARPYDFYPFTHHVEVLSLLVL